MSLAIKDLLVNGSIGVFGTWKHRKHSQLNLRIAVRHFKVTSKNCLILDPHALRMSSIGETTCLETIENQAISLNHVYYHEICPIKTV